MRIRITFSKEDALRFSSQLDVHKIWERAARRSGLPLAYSQGFHPLPKISIANALPLGFSARAEVLEMILDEEMETSVILKELNSNVPGGMNISRIEQVTDDESSLQKHVTFGEYLVKIPKSTDVSDLQSKISEILACKSLPRHRRGKSYDLRPLIQKIILLIENPPVLSSSLLIYLRLSAKEGATGRPEEVLDELSIPIDLVRIERTGLVLA